MCLLDFINTYDQEFWWGWHCFCFKAPRNGGAEGASILRFFKSFDRFLFLLLFSFLRRLILSRFSYSLGMSYNQQLRVQRSFLIYPLLFGRCQLFPIMQSFEATVSAISNPALSLNQTVSYVESFSHLLIIHREKYRNFN